MSDEEVERAIDFLLKSQANSDARMERTNQQIEETNRQLGEFADTQTQLIQVMTRTFEAQAQINESLRAGIVELAARQSLTEESLTRLADVQTDTIRRLDALVEIVRGGQSGK